MPSLVLRYPRMGWAAGQGKFRDTACASLWEAACRKPLKVFAPCATSATRLTGARLRPPRRVTMYPRTRAMLSCPSHRHFMWMHFGLSHLILRLSHFLDPVLGSFSCDRLGSISHSGKCDCNETTKHRKKELIEKLVHGFPHLLLLLTHGCCLFILHISLAVGTRAQWEGRFTDSSCNRAISESFSSSIAMAPSSTTSTIASRCSSFSIAFLFQLSVYAYEYSCTGIIPLLSSVYYCIVQISIHRQ